MVAAESAAQASDRAVSPPSGQREESSPSGTAEPSQRPSSGLQGPSSGSQGPSSGSQGPSSGSQGPSEAPSGAASGTDGAPDGAAEAAGSAVPVQKIPPRPTISPAKKPKQETEAGPGTGSTSEAGPEPVSGPRVESGPASASGTAAKPGTAPKPDAEPGAVPKPGTALPPAAQSAAQAVPERKVGKTLPLPQHPAAQPGSGSDAAAEPESPLERTSKFVALKPLDPPAPPKEQPGERAGDRAAGPGSGTSGAGAGSGAVAGSSPWAAKALPPVPARPPLDLLAELTNTPPPPQTPLRTTLRRVKIWTPVAVLLAIVFVVLQTFRPLPEPTLTLTAAGSYAFDGGHAALPWPDEGQGWVDVSGVGSMDHFGTQAPVPIGSVAKAMTAYVILKDHPLKRGAEGSSIHVDAKAEKEGGYDSEGESTLNTIKAGDTLTERQALSAIMIPSANNVARLLARWDSGSEKAFADKMNAEAKQLGMKHTTYTDPSGLNASTVSTAEDQVKLADELVKIPALMDITRLPTWKDPSGAVWSNYNRLVPYDGAIGIKTGSTTKAGGNLVFAATKEVGGQTVTVVGAILGQHKGPSIIDTVNAVCKTAMLAARDALTSAMVLKKGDVVGYVDDGLGGRTPVVATKDVTAVGWAGLKVGLSLDDASGTPLPHEAKAGTQVGVLSIGGGGKSAGTGGGKGSAIKVPVALQKDLTEPGFGAKLKRVG